MKQDEIIEMAIQADCYRDECGFLECGFEQLEAFAKLVAAKEREACALACEKETDFFDNNSVHYEVCAEAIRARGEA